MVLPASPLELLARGSINAAAVMLGGNSRDGVSVPPTYGPPSDWPNTTAEYGNFGIDLNHTAPHTPWATVGRPPATSIHPPFPMNTTSEPT